ncbi:hypothetical protein OEZ71_08445 [Defluviimonas sp. WL0050]|uniref:Uncharacterized protein n=1 Tax=Albidovulum litorale TaxID=2984134 RepID=A0ABT2ZMI3_9RHOB|nr:hypothetical protein [Defluviimonas sp. WL0050]MCV2872322.1 hypothetical protein [Defluviimonas sp. WL0050]
MRFLWRWLKRALVTVVLLVVALVAPALWVETTCRGTPVADNYQPIITEPDWQRPESRTLLTYPEWHIVHAYEDYAAVIAKGDPQDFGFLAAIGGFWSSLCDLSETSGNHGGFPGETKQMVYTIGVSFTAEMLAKAAYEETLGRIATWLRGPDQSPLDTLSARQAADYAAFLSQVPWYRWDFTADAGALDAGRTDAFRDRERAVALGIEYRVKAAYARVIAAAVEGVGHDQLRLRSIVRGLPPETLAQVPGVALIGTRPEGIEIETDRYAAYTLILQDLTARGTEIVEIAGNDDILLTVLSDDPDWPGALASMARQGQDDYRHLLLIPVSELGPTLRALDTGPARLEHVHDY